MSSNQNMAVEYFQYARHYHASITGPTMVGSREKISKLGHKMLF